jgi:hypothetical protein
MALIRLNRRVPHYSPQHELSCPFSLFKGPAKVQTIDVKDRSPAPSWRQPPNKLNVIHSPPHLPVKQQLPTQHKPTHQNGIHPPPPPSPTPACPTARIEYLPGICRTWQARLLPGGQPSVRWGVTHSGLSWSIRDSGQHTCLG